SRPKKMRRKRMKKVEPDKIERGKGNYLLIITEKPQAAQKIAAALGSARKVTEGGASYFEVEREGKEILVGSAVGHLFNLEYKAGQKGWPIFEIEWRPSYERAASSFTKKYYNLLKKLARKAGEIIIATDYDVEGEVIGWNVLRFIFKRDNAKRMKYSTLTKPELLKAFENPMDELDWGQAYAGETRHILDWLYGINLSRALMAAIKTTGSFKILSIGRVQGPALKIIVDREHEISNFKSEPFWQVFAVVNNPKIYDSSWMPKISEDGKEISGFSFKHPKDIFDKKELEKFKDIKEGVAETKESEERVTPPVPFDLTTLQREAYRLHKIGPSQTLSVVQKLYLDGLISYPRTSSQKIPDAINPKSILKALEKNFPEAKEAKRAKPIEGKKSDPAHPSIYPTGEWADLKENEKKIYELVVKRFISVFSDDAVTLNKRVVITAKEHTKIKFTASGLKIKEKGWTKVYPAVLEEKDVPTLNGDVKIDEIKFVEKETQPPKRYTPTSLITILEKKNLGTKSTRSMIIDTLFNRGYLDGRSIQATPLGMKLIETLEQYSSIIIDENLTRQLEEKMEKLQGSKRKEDLEKQEEKIIKHAEKIIRDISKEFKEKEKDIGRGILAGIEGLREVQNEQNTLRKCPKCGKGDLRIIYSRKTRSQFVACSAYPDCKQTYNLPPNSYIKKSGKECKDCSYPLLMSLKKGKRPWEFCFNPLCEDNKKRREEWERKKGRKIGEKPVEEEDEGSKGNSNNKEGREESGGEKKGKVGSVGDEKGKVDGGEGKKGDGEEGKGGDSGGEKKVVEGEKEGK
ncbi:MAG: DNA topoisomerase I, partial [Nanoarchaeota archaeon]|nr:DNA topoisomerase I [Nanoarchaeota archaeon]